MSLTTFGGEEVPRKTFNEINLVIPETTGTLEDPVVSSLDLYELIIMNNDTVSFEVAVAIVSEIRTNYGGLPYISNEEIVATIDRFESARIFKGSLDICNQIKTYLDTKGFNSEIKCL